MPLEGAHTKFENDSRNGSRNIKNNYCGNMYEGKKMSNDEQQLCALLNLICHFE